MKSGKIGENRWKTDYGPVEEGAGDGEGVQSGASTCDWGRRKARSPGSGPVAAARRPGGRVRVRGVGGLGGRRDARARQERRGPTLPPTPGHWVLPSQKGGSDKPWVDLIISPDSARLGSDRIASDRESGPLQDTSPELQER